jgi:uncharacterized lipoprotein YajG
MAKGLIAEKTMKSLLSSSLKEWVCLVLFAMTIAGCANKPAVTPVPPPAPAPSMELERHHVELGGGVSVDYQIERKISTLNKVSCFAFITGTLNNHSNQGLSRQTVLDFNFFSAGKQVFRDLTSPVRDVQPGASTAFEMVVSPVHKEGCIAYAPIVVSLRKVVVN